MAATAFIDSMTRYCGSRSLVWLLIANVGAALLLWLAALLLPLMGVESSVLYTLFALPSGAMAFALHPWTLLTYMFVHFSPLHLIFNMLWLVWFGRMLADVGRGSEAVRLFITGGILGGVAYVAASALTSYAPGNHLAGASAAVLALMCATAVYMPNRTVNLFLIGEVRLKWLALVCVVITLIGGGGALPTQCAHVAGVAFGLSAKWLRGVWYSMPAKRNKEQREPKIRRDAAKAMRKAAPSRSELNERLDQLLDKIRLSGFDSLTEREKEELNYLSSVIGK